MAYNYTPSDQVKIQRLMAQELMKTPMRRGLNAGQKTDWGRGLAHMLRQYQGGQSLREADTKEATNKRLEKRDLAQMLARASGAEGISGMGPLTTQEHGVPNYETPAAQELALKRKFQQLDADAANAQKMNELDFQRGTTWGNTSLIGQNQIANTLEQGNQTRLTDRAKPVNLTPGMENYVEDQEGPRFENTKPQFAPARARNPYQSEYTKTLQKGEAEKFTEMEGTAGTAVSNIRKLKQFKNASEDAFAGTLAPVNNFMMELASSFGFDPDALTSAAEMEQALGYIQANYMKELGARGLTDQDMKILRQSLPEIGTSREAREKIADIMIKSESAKIENYYDAVQHQIKAYPQEAAQSYRPLWFSAEAERIEIARELARRRGE